MQALSEGFRWIGEGKTDCEEKSRPQPEVGCADLAGWGARQGAGYGGAGTSFEL